MSAYKHILDMLGGLLDTSASHPMNNPSLVPKSPGPPPPPDPNQLPPSQASEYAETVFRAGLQSDDQGSTPHWSHNCTLLESLLVSPIPPNFSDMLFTKRMSWIL